MRIIVQKFGGTSVATAEGRELVRGKIKQALVAGFKPVVVVSAMGRRNDPYATDTLIELLKKELNDNAMLLSFLSILYIS